MKQSAWDESQALELQDLVDAIIIDHSNCLAFVQGEWKCSIIGLTIFGGEGTNFSDAISKHQADLIMRFSRAISIG